MDVIRNRSVVPDRWRLELAAADDLATAGIAPGDVIVSLARWLRDHEQLLARGTRVGVRLDPDGDLDALIGCELHELWLVEMPFASFAEGRGYSQARLLRSRHDFHGDIRASGDVSRDRLAFMERCGFNEFALPEGRDLGAALRAFDEVDLRYQPGTDAAVLVAQQRGYRTHANISSAA
jgi:uncharacterized protein (DUF934 family)